MQYIRMCVIDLVILVGWLSPYHKTSLLSVTCGVYAIISGSILGKINYKSL